MVSFCRIIPRRVKHPKPLVAVVIPVLGLQHMHLDPVLDRVQGQPMPSEVSHTWATSSSYSGTLTPSRLLLGCLQAETQRCGPKSPLEESLGHVIC